jgi:hypothetical protein
MENFMNNFADQLKQLEASGLLEELGIAMRNCIKETLRSEEKTTLTLSISFEKEGGNMITLDPNVKTSTKTGPEKILANVDQEGVVLGRAQMSTDDFKGDEGADSGDEVADTEFDGIEEEITDDDGEPSY